MNPLDNLKERILGNKSSNWTELTALLDLTREFGCLGEILGRDFEVRNPEGKLIANIRQKPIATIQLNKLLKEFQVLKKMDHEQEAAKWGAKKGGSRVNSGRTR